VARHQERNRVEQRHGDQQGLVTGGQGRRILENRDNFSIWAEGSSNSAGEQAEGAGWEESVLLHNVGQIDRFLP
jgi:hypothetical protein